MKKIVLTCVAMATFILFSNAQVSFSIMPKAGVSLGLSRMGLSNYKSYKMQAGFTAGVAFPIGFNEYFEVQPEFYYAEKNSKFTFTKSDGTTTDIAITRKVGQYEIPVLLKGKYNGFYALVGPSLAINDHVQDEADGVKSKATFGSGESQVKKTVWGLQLGVGYSLPLEVGKLEFDARYGWGLTDMDNVTGSSNTTRLDALAITIGYSYPLNK
jgi:hypothetical protein